MNEFEFELDLDSVVSLFIQPLYVYILPFYLFKFMYLKVYFSYFQLFI